MSCEAIENVKECIVKYKIKDIAPSIQKALNEGIPAGDILQDGMVAGMSEIGEGFKNNTVFMPQMLVAAKTMQAGLVVLKPKLAESGGNGPGGKAVVGSVLGDVHDIGKNLVTVMLQGQGLEVADLGADVATDKFVEAVDSDPEVKIVACSSSMTPTRESLKETVTALNQRSDRGNFAVMIGGATMDQMFCDEIGADVYTSNAAACASRAAQYLSGTPLSQVSKEAKETALADMAALQSTDTTTTGTEDGSGEEVIPLHKQKTLTRIERESGTVGHFERNPLSAKDNYRETIKHGKGRPDRFVDQYEYFTLVFDPVIMNSLGMMNPVVDGYQVDGWGITNYTPPGAAGSHPMHGEYAVVKDITHWQDYVKAPAIKQPEEMWQSAIQQMKDVKKEDDRFGAIFMAAGIFERTHELMGMQEALSAYYQNPEEMHEFVDFCTEWEIASMDEVYSHLEPELLFHHDDWGTALNSFLDPATHREFFEPAYKKVYNHFRELGGEVIVHHSDSYAANLIPIMIDIGVDTWQGCIEANNIPECIDKYGDKITFMGGIDEAILDDPSSTPESAMKYAAERIDDCGAISFIPCQTRGLGMTIIPERYGQVSQVIAEKSKEYF